MNIPRINHPLGSRSVSPTVCLPYKSDPKVIEVLQKRYRGCLISAECHVDNTAHLSNREWLLSGDGDVAYHYFMVRSDVVYSVVRVEP